MSLNYRNQGAVFLNLGVAFHGLQDHPAACRYTEAAATFQEAGDSWGELTVQNNLGFIEYELGRYSQAQARLQTTQHSPAWQEYHICPHFWHTLGNLNRDMGDFSQAGWAYQRCLELVDQIEDRLPQVLTLADMALLLLYQGQPQSARIAAETGVPAEEVLALTHQGQAARACPPREREVAPLVTQGKSNREIAEILVLSERTAERHVANILNKLGFNSRAQIAAWAEEKGLVSSSS